MRVPLAILLAATSGCYMGVLRRNAADVVDRRVALAQMDAREALEDITVETTREDGSVTRVLLGVEDMDVEDVADALGAAATALGKIEGNMAVTGAWTECMKDDHGRVKPEKQIKLGSDDERLIGCQYAGRAKSRAWIKAFFRGAWETVTGIWSTIKWTYRALKWALAFAATFFACFGVWQWLGKRRERISRREYSDAFDEMKKNGDKARVLAALSGRRCALSSYEGDRKWRAKKNGRNTDA